MSQGTQFLILLAGVAFLATPGMAKVNEASERLQKAEGALHENMVSAFREKLANPKLSKDQLKQKWVEPQVSRIRKERSQETVGENRFARNDKELSSSEMKRLKKLKRKKMVTDGLLVPGKIGVKGADQAMEKSDGKSSREVSSEKESSPPPKESRSAEKLDGSGLKKSIDF